MKYEWKCKVCGFVVEVERSLDDYDIPPRKEEYADMAGPICLHPETWVKVYTSSTPFETLRDRGVLDRTHFKRGT